MNSITRHCRGARFTLVELLAVLVCSCLLSVLGCASMSARSIAQSKECQSRLHHVLVAASLYESDYGGYPPGYNRTTRKLWSRTLADAGYIACDFKTLSTNEAPTAFHSPDLRCPSHEMPTEKERRQAIHYGWNEQLAASTGIPRNVNYALWRESSFKRADIRQPHRRILLADAVYHFWTEGKNICEIHHGKGNHIFLDGHVEQFSRSGFKALSWQDRSIMRGLGDVNYEHYEELVKKYGSLLRQR